MVACQNFLLHSCGRSSVKYPNQYHVGVHLVYASKQYSVTADLYHLFLVANMSLPFSYSPLSINSADHAVLAVTVLQFHLVIKFVLNYNINNVLDMYVYVICMFTTKPPRHN